MTDRTEPLPDWFIREAQRRALMESLRDGPAFVPGPDPVAEAMKEADALPALAGSTERSANVPLAKHRTPIVPAKVKVALDLLFNDPSADLAKAASAVGMPTARLREQLKLPHVRRYATQERAAFVDALCAGNPAALKDIRDNSANSMARVAAIRQAEIMKLDLDNPARNTIQQPAPGLVVVIQNSDGMVQQLPPAPPPRQIEYEPVGSE
jgi:hypothetical protein